MAENKIDDRGSPTAVGPGRITILIREVKPFIREDVKEAFGEAGKANI